MAMDLLDRKHVHDTYAMYTGLADSILIRTRYHEHQSTPNEQAEVWSLIDRWCECHQSVEDKSYIPQWCLKSNDHYAPSTRDDSY